MQTIRIKNTVILYKYQNNIDRVCAPFTPRTIDFGRFYEQIDIDIGIVTNRKAWNRVIRRDFLRYGLISARNCDPGQRKGTHQPS